MIQLTELHSYSCPNWNSDVKELACNAGDPGSIHALGRSPGKGNGNPPVSFLENPKGRGSWQAAVPGVTDSQT